MNQCKLNGQSPQTWEEKSTCRNTYCELKAHPGKPIAKES